MQIIKEEIASTLDSMTPKEIVRRLDEYIIGQNAGKKAVAIAIRNRWRRRQLTPEMRREVMPKNILMVGPTGVGKTEIARRIAALVNAPFVKVEASKYTEVGFHGRDVESMIRDLVKVAVAQERTTAMEKVSVEAEAAAEERVLSLLVPQSDYSLEDEEYKKAEERRERTREKMRKMLKSGKLDDRKVEISASSPPPVAGVFGTIGGDDMAMEMQDMLGKMLPGKSKERRVSIPEAIRIFQQEEAEKLIDEVEINLNGINNAEQNGIIFIDEVDKIIGSNRSDGPDVSREGVQRDLLPIVEGSAVATKFGTVNTDHILFIAAGAFHGKKPADLIPELQGRFPIRVELNALTQEDYERILIHPKNALTKQYELLMQAEGISLKFNKKALSLMAEITHKVNSTTQDIGARRLHTVMEQILEELSFDAPDKSGEKITITEDSVREKLINIVEDEDLSRFIL